MMKYFVYYSYFILLLFVSKNLFSQQRKFNSDSSYLNLLSCKTELSECSDSTSFVVSSLRIIKDSKIALSFYEFLKCHDKNYNDNLEGKGDGAFTNPVDCMMGNSSIRFVFLYYLEVIYHTEYNKFHKIPSDSLNFFCRIKLVRKKDGHEIQMGRFGGEERILNEKLSEDLCKSLLNLYTNRRKMKKIKEKATMSPLTYLGYQWQVKYISPAPYYYKTDR